MISPKTALNIIETTVRRGSVQEIPIEQARSSILAQDIIAPMSLPPFRQSSMDGYALKLSEENDYVVKGEIRAGQSTMVQLKDKEAVRIFTGAAVPDTADTVVMQEHVIRENETLRILKRPSKLANVRPIGEQLKKGEIALKAGIILNAGGLGFLAGLGISKVNVYKKPSVSLLLTGDELQQHRKSLKSGQVYDSNSITIRTALETLGLSDITIAFIEDTYSATRDCIKSHLAKSDVVLISGGISVGDYDFVREAMLENEVKEHFYKVNQKPGKPLWFGTKGETIVFALPGNPASSLSCFYVYVLPALRKIMGHSAIHLDKKAARLDADVKNPFGKTLFLKGSVTSGIASPLFGQASSMLQSFATSNALLIVPETSKELKKGTSISYLDLTN